MLPWRQRHHLFWIRPTAIERLLWTSAHTNSSRWHISVVITPTLGRTPPPPPRQKKRKKKEKGTTGKNKLPEIKDQHLYSQTKLDGHQIVLARPLCRDGIPKRLWATCFVLRSPKTFQEPQGPHTTSSSFCSTSEWRRQLVPSLPRQLWEQFCIFVSQCRGWCKR